MLVQHQNQKTFKIMKIKFLAVVIIALFVTSGAVAQEQKAKKEGKGGKVKEMIKELDTDGDGRLSMAEAEKAPKGKLKKNFTAIDTDKDNHLDKDELKAYRKEKKEKKEQKKAKTQTQK